MEAGSENQLNFTPPFVHFQTGSRSCGGLLRAIPASCLCLATRKVLLGAVQGGQRQSVCPVTQLQTDVLQSGHIVEGT